MRSTATTSAQSTGAYVRGGVLVVRDGASLPDRCIRCNAPAADGRVTKRFAYNEDESGPGMGTFVPIVGRLFWITWLFNRLNTREYLTVSYCICTKHRTIKWLAVAAMTIGMIAGTIATVMGFANSGKSPANPRGEIDSTTIIIGVLIFFAAALCGLAISGLKVASGTTNVAELTGAGKPFLESLPKFSKTAAMPRY
jgi:hypothetical protein